MAAVTPEMPTQVSQLYVGLFGRAPDSEGLGYWTQQLANGVPLVEIANSMYDTEPARDYFPLWMTNQQIVTSFYVNALGREPDADGLAYWTDKMDAPGATPGSVIVEMIDVVVNYTGTDPDGLQSAALFDNKVEVAQWYGENGGGIANSTAILSTVTADQATADAVMAGSVDAELTFNLTAGLDTLTGAGSPDVFKATQDTLNLGDSINGAGGNDTLQVSISGSGITLAGFESTSVETISVKSLSTNASTLDLSDTLGVTTLESIETDGAALTFRDIQSVEDTNIRIIDTDETHNFTYDANAYGAGIDTVEIELQEIRGAEINFGDVGESLGSSEIDQIDITSSDRDEDQVTPATANVVSDLNVGAALETVNITGDADLTVDAALDENIRRVDAHTLAAALTLDMTESNDAPDGVDEVTYIGAMGDDVIDFGETSNDKVVTLGTGDDLVLTGTGEAWVNGGDGDDIIITGAQNDVVIGGNGNDIVIDAGATDGPGRYFDFGNSFDLGAGDDLLIVSGPANNTADLGAGDDSIVLRAQDLNVDDIVAGSAGTDTMILTNDSGTPLTGMLGESETQRTTGFEVFDLRDGGITLTLTNNLIESAESHSVTVVTESAIDTQTVDMTNITAPDYSFTLQGGDEQDIVIADDSTVNGFSTLRFDNPFNEIGDSTQDTLRVVDGAAITTADLRNVSGLEIIELVDPATSAQIWDLTLNKDIINQTTGNADLVITVDPNVPALSEVHLTIDPAALVDADSNVRIIRNSNVIVYVNGVLVPESQFGSELLPFNGIYGLYVETGLHFTDGADNLIGTSHADLFTADSVNELDNADFADGLAEFDTLRLNFAVANPIDSLSEQLDDARIQNIERIEFNTSNNVSMNGLSWGDWWWGLDVGDLQELATGDGNDTLYNMGDDIRYELNGGDDLITILPNNWWWGAEPTIDGGLGIDTVETATWWGEDDHAFSVQNVEHVTDSNPFNYDSVTILSGGSQAPDGLVTFLNIEVIEGSGDADNILADSIGGSVELYGNGGDDTLTVDSDSTSSVYVNGGDGDDHIYVDAPSSTIEGRAGNDSIDLAVRATAGDDTLVFGTIDYDALQTVELDTQGTDTITGFNMEWNGAGAEDQMDFSAFLGTVHLENLGFLPEYGDWTAGTTTVDMTHIGTDSNVAVIEANAGFTLTADNISQRENPVAGTVQIADTVLFGAQGRTVVIVATDTNSTLGFDQFDVYYVQDVDQDFGAAWQVDLVGQITPATEVGAIASVDNSNIVT